MFQRSDVQASPEEKYLHSLRERVAAIPKKTWADLSPEEKDLISELIAFQSGFTTAPR